jgi:hypothetical protein
MTATAHNGAGAPSDAAEAFAAALSSAAKRGLPEPAPDPRVAAAFALGWQIAVLYRPAAVRVVAPADEHDLLSQGRLSQEQVIEIGLDRVQVAINHLHDPVQAAGLTLPNIESVREALRNAQDTHARAEQIRDLHLELVGALAAVDFRLGKAYGVGRAIADTCRNPTDMERLKAELDPARTALLANWIDDLASAFPPHAAHSVRASLLIWRDWAARATGADASPALWELLRRQGDLWRALLSGEKLGTDMLEADDYLEAADRTFEQLRQLVGRFLRRFPLLTSLIALLFGGGVGLIAYALLSHDNVTSTVVAGLGGILTSLGLTWRGVGGSVGKIVGGVERPLWGAALDRVITEAITLYPGPAPKNDPARERRRLAVAVAERAPRPT